MYRRLYSQAIERNTLVYLPGGNVRITELDIITEDELGDTTEGTTAVNKLDNEETFGVIVLEDSDGSIRCIVVDLTVGRSTEDTAVAVVAAVPLGSKPWEGWIVDFVTALESPEGFTVVGLWHITSTSFP